MMKKIVLILMNFLQFLYFCKRRVYLIQTLSFVYSNGKLKLTRYLEFCYEGAVVAV